METIAKTALVTWTEHMLICTYFLAIKTKETIDKSVSDGLGRRKNSEIHESGRREKWP